jgi:hypothetical protein
MAKTRSATGRFESTPTEEKENTIEETPISIPFKKTTVISFLRIFLMVLLISPWLFMALRKNTIENVSKKITSFYDDNFSCQSTCDCEGLVNELRVKRNNTTGDKNKSF